MSWLHCPGQATSTRSLLVADSSKDLFSESVLACWTTPVASTRSSVTERPNHGNRPALLALRKLDVSNEPNLGTPTTLTIRGQRSGETRAGCGGRWVVYGAAPRAAHHPRGSERPTHINDAGGGRVL
jgi:hypothetical protein